MTIRSCAVFCGSRFGNNPVYVDSARQLGAEIARAGLTLIYGGGCIGLMGATADSALTAGGRVIGVIPSFLQTREVMHTGLSELEVTADMHTRKARMFHLADAFIILPGGLGTFDEMMEILTWKQLGLHDKPIILVNLADWANTVLNALHETVRQDFVSAETISCMTVVKDVRELMACLCPQSQDPQS